MPSYKSKPNGELYCEKHKGWFFSTKYAKTGKIPSQCNLCKQKHWWNPKTKGVRK